MDRLQLVLIIALALAGCCFAQEETNSKSNSTDMAMEEDTSVERKKNDGLEHMYMMVMMFKTFLSTMMSLISPIIQIKSFGLSVIGTFINIARFIMMLKQHHQGGHGGGFGGLGGGWDDNRRYVTLAPNPHVHPIYYPKFNSVERGV